jgi:hypothetical protein
MSHKHRPTPDTAATATLCPIEAFEKRIMPLGGIDCSPEVYERLAKADATSSGRRGRSGTTRRHASLF